MLLGEALRWKGQVHGGGLGGEKHGPHSTIVQRDLTVQHTLGETERQIEGMLFGGGGGCPQRRERISTTQFEQCGSREGGREAGGRGAW